MVDEAEKVLLANLAAGHLLGFDWRQAGRCPLATLVGADKASFLAGLRRCLSRREATVREEIIDSREE